MAATEQVSKIDGLVEIGVRTSNQAVTGLVGMAMIGNRPASLEIAKIDSFTMIQVLVVQHEHLWSDQWIGPPRKVGS